jgi:hypothetical protein
MTMIITYPDTSKSIKYTGLPQSVINQAISLISLQGRGHVIQVFD